MSHQDISSTLNETRSFPPPAAFQSRAHIKSLAEYEALWKFSVENPEKFWSDQAASLLTWFTKWDKTLEWDLPHAKWFSGGKINVSYNCLDRHLTPERRHKPAIIWEGEPGDSRTISFEDLHREVCQFANVLKSQGIKKGDRPLH